MSQIWKTLSGLRENGKTMPLFLRYIEEFKGYVDDSSLKRKASGHQKETIQFRNKLWEIHAILYYISCLTPFLSLELYLFYILYVILYLFYI